MIIIQETLLQYYNKDFTHNIAPMEIEAIKDAFGDIRFYKVIEYLIPRFANMVVEQYSLWQ